MTSREQGLSEWPDAAEREQWSASLSRVARRLQDERGVVEPAWLDAGGGSLWANYGECRLRVAGEDVEVEDEAELFDDLDTWVAFERGAGPGKVLDRDREYMAAWRERLPEQQALWAAAAERVFADVYATTGLRRPWSVSVHDDEEVWPESFQECVGLVRHFDGDPPLPRRELPLPELWLKWALDGTALPDTADDVETAVAHVAEQVQDWLVEELWTAWPGCPGHGHPREVDVSRGIAVWACPTDATRHTPIGRLGSS